jgi:hypothetical protein
MNKPKRHHYLPQFYLESFCRNGGFWVFDRQVNEYRQQTPKNTALQKNYYSFEVEDGSTDTRIETLLAVVEGHGKQAISKLIDRKSLSKEEKEELSLFVALMMNRVPDFENSVNKLQEHVIRKMADMMFSDEKRAQAVMDQYSKDTGKESKGTAKDLVDFYKSGEFEIVVHRNQSLFLMLTLSNDLANLFRQMNWIVLHAPDKTSFVTTDNPVILLPPKGYKPNFYGFGLITKGARKIFPLSANTCLFMLDHGDRLIHRDFDRDTVRAVNLNLTTQSDRFLIGRDEALVRNLVETTKLDKRKREGRFRIS